MKNKKKYRYLGKNEIVRNTDEVKRQVNPDTKDFYENTSMRNMNEEGDWTIRHDYIGNKVKDCFGGISGISRIFRREVIK